MKRQDLFPWHLCIHGKLADGLLPAWCAAQLCRLGLISQGYKNVTNAFSRYSTTNQVPQGLTPEDLGLSPHTAASSSAYSMRVSLDWFPHIQANPTEYKWHFEEVDRGVNTLIKGCSLTAFMILMFNKQLLVQLLFFRRINQHLFQEVWGTG